MADKSPEPALTDIVDAIERIRIKTEGVSFNAFEADWERRWLVERGAEIISEASRRLPDDLKARHPDIPWQKIAGIGNVLRHDYDAVSPRVLWNVARNDLTPLAKAFFFVVRPYFWRADEIRGPSPISPISLPYFSFRRVIDALLRTRRFPGPGQYHRLLAAEAPQRHPKG